MEKTGTLALTSAPKGLTRRKKELAGRNCSGRQVFFHRGGGRAVRYRVIDFCRLLRAVPAIVRRIEYDPNRTAGIALLSYTNEILAYILAAKGLKVDDIVYGSESYVGGELTFHRPGSSNYLGTFPVGAFLHGLQSAPERIAQYMRSQGSAAQLLRKDDRFVTLKLRSGEHRKFFADSIASFGVPGEGKEELQRFPLAKAGRARHLGRRPVVRGAAMNPIDHPHGGGEGKGSAKRGNYSPWGKFSKGTRTARHKLPSRFVVRARNLKTHRN